MAKGWLKALRDTPALRQGVSVVGLVDLDRAAADALAAEFDLQDAATGTDLDAMLSATRPDILFDIVVPEARRAVEREPNAFWPNFYAAVAALRRGQPEDAVSGFSVCLAVAPARRGERMDHGLRGG